MDGRIKGRYPGDAYPPFAFTGIFAGRDMMSPHTGLLKPYMAISDLNQIFAAPIFNYVSLGHPQARGRRIDGTPAPEGLKRMTPFILLYIIYALVTTIAHKVPPPLWMGILLFGGFLYHCL